MQEPLAKLCKGFSFPGDIDSDALEFLMYHGRQDVAKHVLAVKDMAQRIASKFSVNIELARCAGLLHDISLVIPTSDMLQTSLELGIEVIAEEKQVPYLIHGKLSALIAEEVFGIKNDSVIHAISCHSTLCANASSLDKVLFVADKMSWEPEHSPFRLELAEALEKSLDEAVGCFLTWTWNRKDKLDVIHPWLKEAWNDLVPAKNE